MRLVTTGITVDSTNWIAASITGMIACITVVTLCCMAVIAIWM